MCFILSVGVESKKNVFDESCNTEKEEKMDFYYMMMGFFNQLMGEKEL